MKKERTTYLKYIISIENEPKQQRNELKKEKMNKKIETK